MIRNPKYSRRKRRSLENVILGRPIGFEWPKAPACSGRAALSS
jgi:hypothetical protein